MSIAWKIALLLAAGLLVVQGCSETDLSSVDQESYGDSLLPDTRMGNATFYLYQRDWVKSEIRAEELLGFDSIDSTIAYVVDVDVFDSTGALVSELTGDSAVIREETGVMLIFGHVVLVREDGTRLETEYLYYDSRKDSLHTTEFVRITRDSSVFQGWGLDSDQEMTHFKIRETSGFIKNVKNLDEELPKDQ